MRLLVLDGSRLLASLVRRLVREPLDIEEVDSFDDAMSRLAQDPPDALIANVTPADLPWQDLKSFCQSHDPKIPVIFESCVHQTAVEAGIGNLNHSAVFLPKPYGMEALRKELQKLVDHHHDPDLDSAEPTARLRP